MTDFSPTSPLVIEQHATGAKPKDLYSIGVVLKQLKRRIKCPNSRGGTARPRER